MNTTKSANRFGFFCRGHAGFWFVGIAGISTFVFPFWALFFKPAQIDQRMETDSLLSPAAVHPGLSERSPFLNVRPEVAFTGDADCANCHSTISDNYRKHPMGQSLAKVRSSTRIEQFGGNSHSGFTSGPFLFEAEVRGENLIHKEILNGPDGKKVAELSRDMQWVVGSGSRGRSYLTGKDGFLFQSPLTWYVETKKWDFAPQYEKANLHFGRPITPECLFCHCNKAEPVPGSVNRYSNSVFHGEAIGCERCHGPGQLHVAKQVDLSPGIENPVQKEKTFGKIIDPTIANPRHMDHSLREDVCWQCHLQSAERVVRRDRDRFEYRPGLPLSEFLRDFLRPQTDLGQPQFVGVVPQMLASRCYQNSVGGEKLGCISCHDPHALPPEEKKAEFYRGRCLTCHQQQGCRLDPDQRKSKQDDCVACHMPKTPSKFPHLSVTDHRLPRIVGAPIPVVPRKSEEPFPLRPLREDPGSELSRDLGIALVAQADKRPVGETENLARLAMPLLKAAVLAGPKDVAALHARAKALWYLGEKSDALKSFDVLTRQYPDEEYTLHNGAVLALQMSDGRRAAEWSGRLVKMNPMRWEYYKIRSDALALEGDKLGAEMALRNALELYPAGYLGRLPPR